MVLDYIGYPNNAALCDSIYHETGVCCPTVDAKNILSRSHDNRTYFSQYVKKKNIMSEVSPIDFRVRKCKGKYLVAVFLTNIVIGVELSGSLSVNGDQGQCFMKNKLMHFYFITRRIPSMIAQSGLVPAG